MTFLSSSTKQPGGECSFVGFGRSWLPFTDGGGVAIWRTCTLLACFLNFEHITTDLGWIDKGAKGACEHQFWKALDSVGIPAV